MQLPPMIHYSTNLDTSRRWHRGPRHDNPWRDLEMVRQHLAETVAAAMAPRLVDVSIYIWDGGDADDPEAPPLDVCHYTPAPPAFERLWDARKYQL